MKKLIAGSTLVLSMALVGCSSLQRPNSVASSGNDASQSEALNQEAAEKAASLTEGWPSSSFTAAKEMIGKYGDPHETTSETLIWRNIAPFKKIIVHKNVYSHNFPLMHQNALEHVVDYKAKGDKLEEIWNYNGSIVIDRTRGEMASFAQSEPMNILALNLADEIMNGNLSVSDARTSFGREALNFLNGQKTANTEVLKFGTQYKTADQGESVTDKIRWIGDPDKKTIQSQEEK